MEDPSVEAPTEDKENIAKTKLLSEGYRAPWVELYRPRALDDVLGNEETVLRLRAIAKDGNMPNLILCGPPGTGEFVSLSIGWCKKGLLRTTSRLE